MKQLVILLVLVAMAAASLHDEHDGLHCGPLERLKVKQQWSEAYGTGSERLDFAQAVFRTVFRIAPSARRLFDHLHDHHTDGAEFKASTARLLSNLDICIALLDDEETLQSQLHHMHEDFENKHVPRSTYRVFGQALLDVVPSKLGRCFDAGAFEACYSVIAHGIADGAA